MPATGGNEEFVSDKGSEPAFSKDDKRIYYRAVENWKRNSAPAKEMGLTNALF